jgi:outer membrane protein OmpA-like peptidoglycan-associated protein
MKRATALLLGLTGCALPALPRSGDLVDATRVLARAEASPLAESASEDLADAEAALSAAERDHEAHPGSVRAAESAYVALRVAERARLAGVYAADREALARARGAARHLREALARREALAALVARHQAAEARAQADLRKAHRDALEAARGPSAQLLERPDALVFRLSVEETFIHGTSLLRSGAEDRLAALARALLAAPPVAVRLQILDDLEGFRTGCTLLAARRLRRVHDTLRAHGVPTGAFLAPARRPPPGAQIDVVVIDPPVALPSGEPGPS